MLPVYTYGHDFGNAETCGVLFDRGIQRAITLPSATALGSLYDLAQKRSAISDSYTDSLTEALKKGEYVLEYNGGELYLGELALKQSRTATAARGDISRYWSPRSLHLLLSASGSLIPHPEYHLNIVTGLPVETFVNADIRKKVKQALEGEHRFTLNGVRRLAVVRVMKIIMEGAGAIIAHGANGEIMQGCIDPGGRTTDLFVAEGQNPILHLCKGKELGVESDRSDGKRVLGSLSREREVLLWHGADTVRALSTCARMGDGLPLSLWKGTNARRITAKREEKCRNSLRLPYANSSRVH
jgi:plasmid segregation protein ParM